MILIPEVLIPLLISTLDAQDVNEVSRSGWTGTPTSLSTARLPILCFPPHPIAADLREDSSSLVLGTGSPDLDYLLASKPTPVQRLLRQP